MMSLRIRRDCGADSPPAVAARQVLSAGEARWVAAQLGNAAASAADGGSPPEALTAPLAVACGAAAAALALQCSVGSPDSVSLLRCYISSSPGGAALPAVTAVPWEARAPWTDVTMVIVLDLRASKRVGRLSFEVGPCVSRWHMVSDALRAAAHHSRNTID